MGILKVDAPLAFLFVYSADPHEEPDQIDNDDGSIYERKYFIGLHSVSLPFRARL